MTDIVQQLRDLQSSQEVFSCDWSFLLEAATEIERNRATSGPSRVIAGQGRQCGERPYSPTRLNKPPRPLVRLIRVER